MVEAESYLELLLEDMSETRRIIIMTEDFEGTARIMFSGVDGQQEVNNMLRVLVDSLKRI
jgi:hypothetical protein